MLSLPKLIAQLLYIFMNELLISIGSGIIGGFVVLILQKVWDKIEKRKENRDNLLVSPLSKKRILPNDILSYLEPGLYVEKAKEYLGIPDAEYIFTIAEQKDKSFNPQIYFYSFQNCSLKISSLDKKSIDTITIFVRDDHKQRIEIFPNRFDQRYRYTLGVAKIDDDIINNQKRHYDLSSGRERVFAIETYYGRFGAYYDYAYFGTDYKNYENYIDTNDIQLLKEERIVGFCISSNGFFPWISVYEMR